MSKTVFNRNEVDFTKQPMFFGEDQNTQRYDLFKYPEMDKLNQRMLGYFGAQKKFHCRKIEQIIKHSVQNKSTFLHQI